MVGILPNFLDESAFRQKGHCPARAIANEGSLAAEEFPVGLFGRKFEMRDHGVPGTTPRNRTLSSQQENGSEQFVVCRYGHDETTPFGFIRYSELFEAAQRVGGAGHQGCRTAR